MNATSQKETAADVLVIGGGLVGSAVAFGIAERGARVIVLDEGDRAFRAATGNAGLVWYQGKGRGMRRYQEWTLEAIQAWPDFAENLKELTGIDVSYHKPGGLTFCISEAEYESRRDFIILAAGGLMFKRLNNITGPTVTITVEDRQIKVPATDSVAAAMLAAGIVTTHTTPVSGAQRGPYCMMGTCFECLVEIDGVANQQACRTQVREGMTVAVQQGTRDIQS